MERVIVTGAKGFIGTALCKKLRKTYPNIVIYEVDKVDGIDINNWSDLEANVADAFRAPTPSENAPDTKIDAIFHLAAELDKANVPALVSTNIHGTQNIIQLALRFGAKLIFTSSAAVYGNSPHLSKLPKVDSTAPVNLYGHTKWLGEKLIENAVQEYGLQATIFRLFNVFGPGQLLALSPVIPIIINKILKKQPTELHSNGEATRDFVFIDDVVDSLIDAAINPIGDIVKNVGTGLAVTINTLHKLISTCMDSRSSPKVLSSTPSEIKYSRDESRQPAANIINKLEKRLKQTIKFYKNNPH